MNKQTGRPSGYGDKEKRKLYKHLRKRFLKVLHDDPAMVEQGKPCWEGNLAYFDADALHISFIDHYGYAHLSGWQTSNALTQLGIKSLRRRFGGGERRRVRVLPIPEGSVCSDAARLKAETEKWLYEMPKFALGPHAAEIYRRVQHEYKQHGMSRRTERLFLAIIEGYPDEEREQLQAALAGEGVSRLANMQRILKDFVKRLRVETCVEPGYEELVKVYFMVDRLGQGKDVKEGETFTVGKGDEATIIKVAREMTPNWYEQPQRYYEYYEHTARKDELALFDKSGLAALGYTPDPPGEHECDDVLGISYTHPVARLIPPTVRHARLPHLPANPGPRATPGPCKRGTMPTREAIKLRCARERRAYYAKRNNDLRTPVMADEAIPY